MTGLQQQPLGWGQFISFRRWEGLLLEVWSNFETFMEVMNTIPGKVQHA